MYFFHQHGVLVSFFLAVLPTTGVADVLNSGFDVYLAAQVMMDKSSHSWEWGTAAEALLELYASEISVFGTNPFPNGQIPSVGANTLALTYAKQFISTELQVLIPDSAVGDPASLGVSALLLGTSESKYTRAAERQADYILNQAPRWSNGAISHRPDVAEIWADNMAMSFPFLAYFSVQQNNASLMAETVRQCGLQRDVLKSSGTLSWRHIIGPQSGDSGLWATGNGWAAYGMARVLNTVQKWSGSLSMTSQAAQLKGWIKEILDGAMSSGLQNGLLRNYLDDTSWFGEISGTALLSAVAYRMAVNDPEMFPQKYITWADKNRNALSSHGAGGVFSPAVDPYDWHSRTEHTTGSPEGQAFMVYLYAAYRDCVNARVCAPSTPSATTISKPGIGPIDIMTVLDYAITFSSMPSVPTGCRPTQGCDLGGCAGAFNGLAVHAQCTAGSAKGCPCKATSITCGPRQSCDKNGCAGGYGGVSPYPQCKGNFVGCDCDPVSTTCGPRQSCELNGCAGKYNGLSAYPQCTGNFVGCDCIASPGICGPHQSCDKNNCNGKFLGSAPYAQCTTNFLDCKCTATATTCGSRQSCDMNDCNGAFWGTEPYPRCTKNFYGCPCQVTKSICGAQQSCDNNGCEGKFDLKDGLAYCSKNFEGCQCRSTINTCGKPQSCDGGNCQGNFVGQDVTPQCTGFFKGCQCTVTSATCGAGQSCDLNGCAGTYDSSGVARCQGNFKGCGCKATSKTCGVSQNCDKNGCNGAFLTSQGPPTCRGSFAGCPCLAVSSTCGGQKKCSADDCHGAITSSGNAVCLHSHFGCPCTLDPVSSPPPPPSTPQEPPAQQEPSGPTPVCVTARCFMLNSIVTGDVIQLQIYSSSQYLFYLQAGKRWASSDTSYHFNNIADPNGRRWTFQVDGNCGHVSYQTDLQKTQGMITLQGVDRQQWFPKCEGIGEHTTTCWEVESNYRDSSCPSGSEPPFCDYSTYCKPANRPGEPKFVAGSAS